MGLKMILLYIGCGDSIMAEFEDILKLVATADMTK